MNKTPILLPPQQLPLFAREYFSGIDVFDSSCSREASVYYTPKYGGLYLKTGLPGTLRREAEMTRFFHSMGLATEVLHYESGKRDWLMTRSIPGEDCTHQMYCSQPQRLCDTLAELLRALHEKTVEGCPIPNHSELYYQRAKENHLAGQYDLSFFPGHATVDEIWHIVEDNESYLKNNTLLHGDFCLPNVMLDNWRFTGFLDLDNAGIGDRHVDLFWGMWTLNFNLKTDRYRDRFLDVYGRDRVNPDVFPVISAFEVFG